MKYFSLLKITVEITNNVHGSQIYYTTQKNPYLMAIYDPSNMIVWKGHYQKDQIETCNYVEQNLVLPYKVAAGLWSKEVQFYIFNVGVGYITVCSCPNTKRYTKRVNFSVYRLHTNKQSKEVMGSWSLTLSRTEK